jgi:PAS domain S-box-containing protein
MAKDRLKRRIAEALQGSSVRDALKLILAGDDEARPDAGHGVPHSILDDVKDPILTVAEDGIVQEANAAAARLLSAPVTDIVGQDVARFLPALMPALPTLDALAERVADTFVDAAPEHMEVRCRDGQPLTVEVTVSRAAAGQACASCCACATSRSGCTTSRHCAKARARYRALVENAPEAIVVLDVDRNVFVEVNDNAVKLFGLRREELLHMRPEALWPERQSDGQSSSALHASYVERALRGARPVFEWLHRDGEGKEYRVKFASFTCHRRSSA